MHDYFRTADVDVELYGYDHSLEMVNLSALIQNELATDVTLRCYGQLEQLLRAIPERRAPANVIVTFGHVLVQLVDDTQARGVFADILEYLTHMDHCLVVAVDAHGYGVNFRRSYIGLCETLAAKNCTLELNPIGGSSAFGVLRKNNDYA